MNQYFLTPHVHLCLADGQVILLDLKADRYLGLGDAESRAVAPYVVGWPIDGSAREPNVGDREKEVSTLLEEMVRRQLLTSDPAAKKQAADFSLPQAQQSLVPFQAARPRIDVAMKCIYASAVAAWLLRRRSLEDIVERAHRRKLARHTAGKEADLQVARQLVAAFISLRPFLFTARDACLFDSLALSEFLAQYSIVPTWVVGVLATPFSAHSWLQINDVVLNDFPENVLRYSPILTV